MAVVTFDFDDTLTEPKLEDGFWVSSLHANEKILDLLRNLAREHTVHIVTSRNKIHSKDVFDFADKHDLPVEDIHFTNGSLKAEKLQSLGSVMHFDDSVNELNLVDLAEGIKPIIVPHPWDEKKHPKRVKKFTHVDSIINQS
jgi:uncharacterized HAD superfamily protein